MVIAFEPPEERDAPITDESLRVLGGLPELEAAALKGGAFTDAGLAHLGELKRLKVLDISRGRLSITDAGLQNLVGLTSLEHLAIQGSNVTQQGVWELKQALPKLRGVQP